MATSSNLVELDSLSIHVIVDNELDPISGCPNADIVQSGSLKDNAAASQLLQPPGNQGSCEKEVRRDETCCSTHGLSVLITGCKDGIGRAVLFDTSPEGSAWERNVRRLKLTEKMADVELVHLSHWHRDHSGGMRKALSMIREAKAKVGGHNESIVVDLHPHRPAFREFQPPNMPPFFMQTDPTFDEIAEASATITAACCCQRHVPGFRGDTTDDVL